LYYLHDANFNVVALADTNGAVQERYVYDAYGRVTIYNGDWSSTRSSSSYGNYILYTGRHLDPETGMYFFNARYYHPPLGRFTARDPLQDDATFYAYCGNGPLDHTDAAGLQQIPFGSLSAAQCAAFRAARDAWLKEVTSNPMRKDNTGCTQGPGSSERDSEGKLKKCCKQVAIIVALPDPCLPLTESPGHSGIGFPTNDFLGGAYYDFGPVTPGDRYPEKNEIVPGGPYYSARNPTLPMVREFYAKRADPKSDVIEVDICMTLAEGERALKYWQDMAADWGMFCAGSGNHCTSNVRASIDPKDRNPTHYAAVSPNVFATDYLTKLRHTCGRHKGELVKFKQRAERQRPAGSLLLGAGSAQ